MNRAQAKRVAQQLLGILLLAGCGGGSGKRPVVDGGAGGNTVPVFGGVNGAGYGGNGGAGTTSENAQDGEVLGLGGSYSFGTRQPWAGVGGAVADAVGSAVAGAVADAVVDAGEATTLGPSTAAEACAEYHPAASAVVVPTESDCSVVANQYETLEYRTDKGFTCFTDGTPNQSCTMTMSTQSAGACGDPDGWRLTASSTAFFGGAFGFWAFAEDYSEWDGIGIWARLEQRAKTEFPLTLLDATSQPIVDPTTGYPSCYYDSTTTGQDWDHDGVANLSPPPESLRCKGIWSVTIVIDQQWRFLMLPWSVWRDRFASPADAIDPKTLSVLTFQFLPCSDFALQLGWVGAYRAKP